MFISFKILNLNFKKRKSFEQKKISHFSYPYGGYQNINFEYTKILKNLGYLSAVTTIRKKLHHSNQFELPRMFVNNDDHLLRLKLKLLGFRKFY
jgi:hypothetical protein